MTLTWHPPNGEDDLDLWWSDDDGRSYAFGFNEEEEYDIDEDWDFWERAARDT